MSKLHRSQFIKEIKETWPHLATEINAENGLIHLEIAVVRRFAQELIDCGDRDALAQCFAIMQKYMAGGNTRMRNAVDVSFIEDLDFRETEKHDRSWAWDILPDSLKELYVQFHGKRDA